MNRKQLSQAHVLRKYNEGLISRKAASEAMQLSERQVSRLSKGMREEGESVLIHKNKGRKPSHALTAEEKMRIISIRTNALYDKCNHRHFKELLEREHGIRISYTALYTILKEAGIKSPKKRKRPTKHRRRKRKASIGELLQVDASPYDWLGIGNLQALHGSIDDATGRLTGLYMTENECLHGYLTVMRQTVTGFGVPLQVYSDKHTIFRSPLAEKKAEAGEEANLTQYGRALDELGISIIYANSPQAKGRIERLWETLQSRLPVELRIRGINTIEEANRFLSVEYLVLFNNQFSIPAEGESMFVEYKHTESIDDILCIKEERKTDNAGVFSFKGQRFKVLDEGYPLIPARAKVDVLVSVKDSVRVRYKGRVFGTALHTVPNAAKVKAKHKKSVIAERNVKPHLCHSTDEWCRVWHFEGYADTLNFIYDIFFRDAA